MTRKKIDFTVEEVLEEVAEIFEYHFSSIVEMIENLGCDESDFYSLALGIEKIEQPITFMENRTCFTVEKIKKHFSIYVCGIEGAYEYVANGITLDAKQPVGDVIEMEGIYASNLLDNWLKKDSWLKNQKKESKYEFLLRLANARIALDEDDDLKLKELALLAGVDERTIRNAASAGAFETIKSGSETLVPNKEARKWLNSRPDFKPTKYRSEQVNSFKSNCCSTTEFGQFVAIKRNDLELKIEDIAQQTGTDVEILIDLEKGIDRINLSQISKLQNALKIENNSLLNDYMKIFHQEELLNLAHLFKEVIPITPKRSESKVALRVL